MVETEIRRRRRPPVSCTLCRQRKIRCNKEAPCSNCLRSRKAVSCVYEDLPPVVVAKASRRPLEPRRQSPHYQHEETDTSRASSDQPSQPQPLPARRTSRETVQRPQQQQLVSRVLGTSASFAMSPTERRESTPSQTMDDEESLRRRIQALEATLEAQTETLQRLKAERARGKQEGSAHIRMPTSHRWSPSPGADGISGYSSEAHLTADFFVQTKQGQVPMTSRSVMHKTRLFGQSHWINSIVGFRDIFEMLEPLISDSGSMKLFSDMHRLKQLARVVKAQHSPGWPPRPTGLPPRDLADQLVQSYMRSSESIYRVVHIPLFMKSYEAVWKEGATSDPEFLIQLKLVMAIGSATHERHTYLRTRAVRWIYDAQLWLSEPEFKQHLTLHVLQAQILMLLAREAISVGSSLTWISAGDTLRAAMYMGLHRDPTQLPKQSTRLAAEMRRRLWNTLLEIVVSTSIDAGASPLLSISDFDTQPPGNFDDEELMEGHRALEDPQTHGRHRQRQKQQHGNNAGEPMPPQPTTGDSVNMNASRDADISTEGAEGQSITMTTETGNEDEIADEFSAAAIAAAKTTFEEKLGSATIRMTPEPASGAGDSSAPPQDMNRFTRTSLAIALRQTLPVRLAITHYLNDTNIGSSYPEVLRLDKEFRTAYRTMCETLQRYAEASSSPTAGGRDDTLAQEGGEANPDKRPQLTHFQLSIVDLVLRRYLVCLHAPYNGAAPDNDCRYAFSRRVIVDTAIKIWNTACPGTVADVTVPGRGVALPHEAPKIASGAMEGIDQELVRITLLGSGALRKLVMKASLMIAVEIKFQLMEDDAQGGARLLLGGNLLDAVNQRRAGHARAPVRNDLLEIVDNATAWCYRAIEMGETNFKGYLLNRLVWTQIDGMRRGMMSVSTATPDTKAALGKEVLGSATNAVDKCMPVMERLVLETQETARELDQEQRQQQQSLQEVPVESQVPPAQQQQHRPQLTALQQQRPLAQPQQLQSTPGGQQLSTPSDDVTMVGSDTGPQQLLSQMAVNTPMPIQSLGGSSIEQTEYMAPSLGENWDFLMPDTQSGGETLSWLFNDPPLESLYHWN